MLIRIRYPPDSGIGYPTAFGRISRGRNGFLVNSANKYSDSEPEPLRKNPTPDPDRIWIRIIKSFRLLVRLLGFGWISSTRKSLTGRIATYKWDPTRHFKASKPRARIDFVGSSPLSTWMIQFGSQWRSSCHDQSGERLAILSITRCYVCVRGRRGEHRRICERKRPLWRNNKVFSCRDRITIFPSTPKLSVIKCGGNVVIAYDSIWFAGYMVHWYLIGWS